MKPNIFIIEDAAVKIQFNKRFNFYEALTAAINPKTGAKIQKFGNEYNCTAATETECKNKIISILT